MWRPGDVAAEAGESGETATSDSYRSLLVVVVAVTLLVGGVGGLAATTTSVDPGPDREAAPPVSDGTAGLETLHERGLTGEDVRVGVVDVTGFDTSHPTLAGHVTAARSFAPDETVANGGRNGHGTAAASLVARTAPDAELYLASFDTVDGYRSAVAWMVQQDVDVLVAPVSFYGQAGDGSSEPARVASRAAQLGVVVVASAGNVGRGHWAGRYDAVADGRLVFGDSTRNYLRGDRRRLSLWVSWDRSAEANYTVELYAADPEGDRLVARSQPYLADEVPNERIVAQVDPGTTYYFTVDGPDESTGTRLTVTSPTHAFQYRRRAGSVLPPATGRNVIAVGAYNERIDRAEPFSSAGPVGRGRPGVDLLAPDRLSAPGRPQGFVGSSAAAPYVGGVAALLLGADANATAGEVERALESTARDVGPEGVDPLAGHGRVQPARAVRAVANGTESVG